MTTMNEHNSQANKELGEIKEVMNRLGIQAKDKEVGRAESLANRVCSVEVQHEYRPKDNHHSGNFLTRCSRVKLPKFGGQDLRT